MTDDCILKFWPNGGQLIEGVLVAVFFFFSTNWNFILAISLINRVEKGLQVHYLCYYMQSPGDRNNQKCLGGDKNCSPMLMTV